jgi:hypothetical protein
LADVPSAAKQTILTLAGYLQLEKRPNRGDNFFTFEKHSIQAGKKGYTFSFGKPRGLLRYGRMLT